MKKLIAIAALCAGASLHAKPEDWYLPDDWIEEGNTVTVTTYDDNGNKNTEVVRLNSEGKIPEDVLGRLAGDDPLVKLALDAAELAMRDQEQIKTVGKRLDSLASNGIKVNGTDANGNAIAQTITISTGLNTEGKQIEGTTDASYNFADGKTIAYSTGAMPKLRLYGAPEFGNVGKIPYWDGSKLDWFFLKNLFNTKTIDHGAGNDTAIPYNGITLAGFAGKSFTTLYNLADYATNRTDAVIKKNNLSILVRDGNTDDTRLRYMDIGSITSASMKLDDTSVKKTEEDDPKVEIAGFGAANDTAIPQKSENALTWVKPEDLFAKNLFVKNDDGKITLKGVSATENVQILTVSSGETPTISQSGMDTLVSNGLVFDTTDKKIEIQGFKEGTAEADTFAHVLTNGTGGAYKVMAKGANGVAYFNLGQVLPLTPLLDNKSISTNAKQKPELQIAGFANKAYTTGYDLADYMTNRANAVIKKDNLSVLVRDGNAYDTRVRYMDIGSINTEETPADEKSITKDAEDTKKIQLVGFEEADAGAAGSAKIPYTEGDGLEWKDLTGFFSENVFKKTATGKIILNGIEEGDTESRIITVKGSDDAQSVDTFAADNVSVDFESTGGHIQLHGFHNVAGFAVENDLAEILTNQEVSVEGQYLPIVVKQAGVNVIKYAPVAKINGSPFPDVDGATIEINEDDPTAPYLQLKGADAELEEGMVYAIDAEGNGHFVKLQGDGEGDANPSIEIAEDDDGNRVVRLYGWNNTIEGNGIIGWDEEHALKYFQNFGSGVVLDDNSGLKLSRYPNTVGAIPYTTLDSGNDDSLNWLSGADKIPMLKNNAAPVGLAIGNSITTANVNSTPTLNISGFASASAGQVPTKNAAGGITWKDAASEDANSYGSITYVSDVTWDADTHQLKVTKTTVQAKIMGTATTETSVVFTATSHADEHEGE